MLVLILNEVNRFDNIDVMESRRDTELGSELLDVLLLRLVFPTFSEFLSERFIDEQGEGGEYPP